MVGGKSQSWVGIWKPYHLMWVFGCELTHVGNVRLLGRRQQP